MAKSAVKKLACSLCGRAVDVGEEAISATCSFCVQKPKQARFIQPPAGGAKAARDGCCNFSHGGCVIRGDGKCPPVEASGSCGWLEVAVMPTLLTARFCDCGNPIGHRERLCSDCRRRNRRASIRAAVQKARKNGHVSS